MYLSARASVRWLRTYATEWKGREEGWDVQTIPSDDAGDDASFKFRAGGPLIYRLLRPLTVSGIIVHRTRQSDLAFNDEQVVEIVRFHSAAYDMFTRQEVLEKAPEPKLSFERKRAWSGDHGHTDPKPFERIRDTFLRRAADALTTSEAKMTERCMSHTQFIACWEHGARDGKFHQALAPVTSVFDDFNPHDNPVFWFRLLGYSYACNWYLQAVKRHEHKLHIELGPPKFDLGELLQMANRPDLFPQSKKYIKKVKAHFDSIIRGAL
jgi:hypothetical protein